MLPFSDSDTRSEKWAAAAGPQLTMVKRHKPYKQAKKKKKYQGKVLHQRHLKLILVQRVSAGQVIPAAKSHHGANKLCHWAAKLNWLYHVARVRTTIQILRISCDSPLCLASDHG